MRRRIQSGRGTKGLGVERRYERVNREEQGDKGGNGDTSWGAKLAHLSFLPVSCTHPRILIPFHLDDLPPIDSFH